MSEQDIQDLVDYLEEPLEKAKFLLAKAEEVAATDRALAQFYHNMANSWLQIAQLLKY